MSDIDAAKYIIKNTPTGLLPEIYDYLKNIIPNIDSNQEIKQELKSYEEDHFKQVPLNDDTLIISKFNKDSEGFYHDQTKKYKLQINPLNENFEKLEKITTEYPLQVLLDKKIAEYKQKYYQTKITSHNVYYTEENGKFDIKILISSHYSCSANFQNGEWISSYNLKKDEKDYSLTGEVKLYTHYFEDNNCQFHLNKHINEKIEAQNNDELTDKVVSIIEKTENDIQTKLANVYQNFSQDYTKPLGRKLPFTGTKMNWSMNQLGLK